jgi:hypothetical protein
MKIPKNSNLTFGILNNYEKSIELKAYVLKFQNLFTKITTLLFLD